MKTTTTSTSTIRSPSPSGDEIARRARQWPKSVVVLLLLLSLLSVVQHHRVQVVESATHQPDLQEDAPLVEALDEGQGVNVQERIASFQTEPTDKCGLQATFSNNHVEEGFGLSASSLNIMAETFAAQIRKPKFKLRQFWKTRARRCSESEAEEEARQHLKLQRMTDPEIDYTMGVIKTSAAYQNGSFLRKLVCIGRVFFHLGKWRRCDKNGPIWKEYAKELKMCKGDKWRVCAERTKLLQDKKHSILLPPSATNTFVDIRRDAAGEPAVLQPTPVNPFQQTGPPQQADQPQAPAQLDKESVADTGSDSNTVVQDTTTDALLHSTPAEAGTAAGPEANGNE